jgi:small GTP-binding protein
VLTPAAEQQLMETRSLLGQVRETLARVPATDQDARTLITSIGQLDDFFLLVVVGEFNAGKSAFINALLGERVLDEGVTPTTSRIHLLRYGEQITNDPSASGIHVVTAPLDLLRDVHIVDTPGTNAIIREHEQLTGDFVPRSDLVLFVTSSDRPFTETERAFLETIRDWGKKIVLIVNKVDIFERPRDDSSQGVRWTARMRQNSGVRAPRNVG